MPAATDTDGRGEPLTEGDVRSKTDTADRRILGEGESAVNTGTYTNKDVVKGLVGLIRTANDITVLVAICILLSESVHGEKEACSCKSSNKHFDTFHNNY